MQRHRTLRPAFALVLGVAAFGAAGLQAGATDTTTPGEGSAAAAEVDRTDWPETITFAAVPSEESTALQESYAPVIAAIEGELGVSVEFVQAADYAGVIEGQIAGNVALAQYGPFSYVVAVQNGAAIEPIGALIDAPGAEPGYQSFGIVAGDNTEINGLEDFAGQTVCFVDPTSTSGFLYPAAGLIEAGVIASASEEDLAAGLEPIFAGGHDASAIAVATGDCDAGFAFDTMVTTELIEAGEIAEGDLRVVWESEVIAGSPVAVSTQLPQSLRDELSRVFLEVVNSDALREAGYCTAPDPAATVPGESVPADAVDCGITDEGSYGYAPVDDAFYDGVREVCETTQAPQCAG
jgi:phosphonate transport system substrate-binding protein